MADLPMTFYQGYYTFFIIWGALVIVLAVMAFITTWIGNAPEHYSITERKKRNGG